MNRIESAIYDINEVITGNIDILNADNRGLVSQNLLAQSRNLIEHLALRAYMGVNPLVKIDYQNINEAREFIKHDNKYAFLREFHFFLQESKSHYTPDFDGAERLMLKYYDYFVQIKDFAKNEFNMDLLNNLSKFPLNQDKTLQAYYEKIATKLKRFYPMREYEKGRFYVQGIRTVSVEEEVFFEVTLTPAYDMLSKFNRFVAYTKTHIPAHYALKIGYESETIDVSGKQMSINILTDYKVSLRPCELNNFAKILGKRIDIKSNSAEYNGLMGYLSKSGASLLDIVLAPESDYKKIKGSVLERAKVSYFYNILDEAREFLIENNNGSNVIRYLLQTMKNKVLKEQWNPNKCPFLSNLNLEYGCEPFDKMPYASSLKNHNPEAAALFYSIDVTGREHELLAHHIQNNASANGQLYTKKEELECYGDVDALVCEFNQRVYKKKHAERYIQNYGKNYYVDGDYKNTKYIIEKLIKDAEKGVIGYPDYASSWISDNEDITTCAEKREILQNMFSGTRVKLIYGAAGTGKTFLINLVAQMFDDKKKLFLANTHPAVDNLRRKVSSQNCSFFTIKKYVSSWQVDKEYDILFMDECSMVSNRDMCDVLAKTNYKLLVLVGDTYQIESITFGNWFSLAKFFLPRIAWSELVTPFRAQNDELLLLWQKVRNLEKDLDEHIVPNKYSSPLNETIFEKKAEDEIILCLNYNGLYGINNINRFLQCNNSNPAYTIGVWTYKVGDQILFNESERFAPVIYNNLKGTIIDISTDTEFMWFTIELEKAITEFDAEAVQLELLPSRTQGKSVVKFSVRKADEGDDDGDTKTDSVIPFQIAYAVSIHKAQGLEYDSVKVVITQDIEDMISHNIFYTAITRAKKELKIYWSPESQRKIIESFVIDNSEVDASIFSAQTGIRKQKCR